ncbi:hypothetical protein HN51_067164 [Arachis hypogaea]
MITQSSNGRRKNVWNNVTRLLNGVLVILVGKVHFSFLSGNFMSFSVIGHGSFFGGVEGSKPNANTFPWIANLRRPFSLFSHLPNRKLNHHLKNTGSSM